MLDRLDDTLAGEQIGNGSQERDIGQIANARIG